MTVVNASDFDKLMDSVMTGAVSFYVPTAYKCWKLDRAAILKWEARGRKLIRVASDGKGFRMGQGKSSVYVLPGQLICT